MNSASETSLTREPTQERTSRLTSIDMFRGGVMFLMMAEVLHFCHVSDAFPGSRVAGWLCHHQTHVPWRGCSIHDLIQPGFSFLVGTSLAFSIAIRKSRGQSERGLLLHAAWRSVVLILLGIFLRSLGRDQTNWTFVDTLTQIGLGYLPLVVIGLMPRWVTWLSIGMILLLCFTAFALTPLPPADFDTTTVGVPADWEHWEEGFAAHWNKNTNLAARFDQYFLNFFPRENHYAYNPGGYATLSFVPTLATMLLGLIAGQWLRNESSIRKQQALLLAGGLICLAAGTAMDISETCISVKRIWTPSWVLVSGGWCFMILMVSHLFTDVLGWKRIAFPWIVIGMNSIAAYVMAWFIPDFMRAAIDRHLGVEFKNCFGEPFSTVVVGTITLTIIWLILFWMHRRHLYLKI